MTRTCRLCREVRETSPLAVCEPCREAIGVETYDALLELEMRLSSGRNIPTMPEYATAWANARAKVKA